MDATYEFIGQQDGAQMQETLDTVEECEGCAHEAIQRFVARRAKQKLPMPSILLVVFPGERSKMNGLVLCTSTFFVSIIQTFLTHNM
jgi:hypothetical protein